MQQRCANLRAQYRADTALVHTSTSTSVSGCRRFLDFGALGARHRTVAAAVAETRKSTIVESTVKSNGAFPSARPDNQPGDWFFTEGGQRAWVDAMELDTLTPNLPLILRDMGARYDPDKLAELLRSRRTELYARAVRVAASLGGFIARLLQDIAFNRVDQNMQRRATELRTTLGELGPSFVKIGQALSARPDLLPQVYLDTLSGLQDRLPSFPSSIAFSVIEEELGRPLNEVYSEITPEPVAAASLGQVYKARLRATGDVVAVKVQRPSIADGIAIDMLLLRRLMGLVDKNIPQISQPLVPLVDEFAARLFGELDYVQEGHNCERFQQLYGHIPRVRTPTIYWDYTARRVLTMQWIDGVKLTDKAAMEAAQLDIVDFVDVGIECTLRQLLEDGFFHADPHPGNLLATTSGDLVYLDFGMMSRVPEDARYAIIAHVCHLVNRDYEAMCRDYYRLEFIDPGVDTTPIAPALAEFFDDVLAQSVSQLNFKAIIDGLGEVLFKYPFRVPAYYALILRSLTVLEGLALQADANYKLLGRAYPYIARRLLTDPAPELRECFEELILRDGEIRWGRLDNLLNESSKSYDYNPQQLWMLAEWMVSDNAYTVRGRLVSELVRMVDAVAASDLRSRIRSRIGSAEAAAMLVPVQPREYVDRDRALAFLKALMDNLGTSLPQFQGSGPMGIVSVTDIQAALSNVQRTASETWPRLQHLLAEPGAKDIIASATQQLSQRFAARAIKFVFAAPDVSSLRSQPALPADSTATKQV